jgi:uncharacterized protein YjiS (DUF1127 family)
MNDTLAAAAVQHRSARVRPAQAPRRRRLLDAIATWEERTRVRWRLERMSRDDPRLIDDIGLTRRQVEVEIAKPFWRP